LVPRLPLVGCPPLVAPHTCYGSAGQKDCLFTRECAWATGSAVRTGIARSKGQTLGGKAWASATDSGSPVGGVIKMRPRHISSVEPSPQVTKCGGTRRRIGS
jgi:hypothetical protein